VATATAGAMQKLRAAAKVGFWTAWLAPIIGIVGGIRPIGGGSRVRDRSRTPGQKDAFISLGFRIGLGVFGQFAWRLCANIWSE